MRNKHLMRQFLWPTNSLQSLESWDPNRVATWIRDDASNGRLETTPKFRGIRGASGQKRWAAACHESSPNTVQVGAQYAIRVGTHLAGLNVDLTDANGPDPHSNETQVAT